MSIKYEIEDLELLVDKFEIYNDNLYESLSNLHEISSLLNSNYLHNVNNHLQEAIDNLHDQLSNKFIEDIDELIDALKNNNDVILDTDKDIADKMGVK